MIHLHIKNEYVNYLGNKIFIYNYYLYNFAITNFYLPFLNTYNKILNPFILDISFF